VTPIRLASCAIAIGLLFLSKYGAVIVLPMLLLMALVRALDPEPLVVGLAGTRSAERAGGKLAVLCGVLLLAGAVTLVMIWAAYGFAFRATHGASTPYNWARVEALHSVASRLVLLARDLRILPETWLYGLGYTFATIQGRVGFLNGAFRTTGWWWYFPYAVAIKTPLGTLGVMALAALGALAPWLAGHRDSSRHAGWIAVRRTAPLWILLVVYWAASLASHINIGLRHVLPTVAPAFVLAGSAVRFGSRRAGRVLLLGLLAATGVESAMIRPDYLAYFNVFGGGPDHGYRHLVDSNLDWGQDLPGLARWLVARREEGDARPCYLAYFGSALPAGHGVDCRPLPSFFDLRGSAPYPALEPGIYAVSATMLQSLHVPAEIQGAWTPEREQRLAQVGQALETMGGDDPRHAAAERLYARLRFARLMAALREREPDARIGHSILIYDLDERALATALGGPLRALGASAPRR
jgi:hypothetical protein